MIEYQKILNKNLLNVFIEILKEVEEKGLMETINYILLLQPTILKHQYQIGYYKNILMR